MKLKKFAAPTYNEAMLQAKLELGSEIRVIQQRTVRVGGFFGFFTREQVELLAMPQPRRVMNTLPQKQFLQEIERLRYADKKGNKSDSANSPGSAPEKTDTARPDLTPTGAPLVSAHVSNQENPSITDSSARLLLKDLADLRESVEEVERSTREIHVPRSDWGSDKFRNYLDGIEFAPELSRKILDEIKSSVPAGRQRDEKFITTAFRDRLAGHLKTDREINFEKRPRIIALIGPTGVGKTTTVAKLAAHFQFKEQLNVAFITLDTYRLGATDQLERYSDLLEVPLSIAFNLEQFEEQLENYSDRDLILIDTAGRSPNNLREIKELKKFLSLHQDIEKHLVLSSVITYTDMVETYEKFSTLDIDRMVFTKLDECTIFGPMLSVQLKYGHPVAYLTNGQTVPENILFTTPGELAKLVIPEEMLYN